MKDGEGEIIDADVYRDINFALLVRCCLPCSLSLDAITAGFLKGAIGLKMTRHQKRKIDETHVEKEFTKVKNIATIELGRYEIETWYFSPLPPQYNDCLKLFFCEFSLNFMKRKEQLHRHMVSRA
ncbi:hypothetical protein RIF29_19775 [Crotalaria pallida]|uniref:Histone acetyltransferase n=1 Tax=Crotalaria pallida TaxID=3830 RepID=A0AAN9F1B0_CROPI